MTLPDLNFIVTIDVEEDNWGFEGCESSIENIRMIPRLQGIFDRYEIKPSYLVTYQVASRDWAVNIFSDIFSRSKCEIGAHLHPWNTPPLREVINERNSMLKNLPYELQSEKLKVLTDKIESAFGIKPKSFRAGRWGLGPDTVKALVECGYLVDSSVTPTISWASCGDGPEYSDATITPHRMPIVGEGYGKDNENSILEVPVTIGFNRWPFELCQKIHLASQTGWLKSLKAASIMHHTGLLRKIWLSPEVSSPDDMITLSKLMIKKGIRYLNLNFHSTTLLPGKSPFVRNDDELDQFYLSIERLLDYLVSATNLSSLTLSEVGKQYSSLR